VRQLSDGSVLVIAADESAAARVEAVRRDFVANISHELKTPISSISLLAEATLDGADDPETVRHFTGKTLREATRLGALVTELIALSKLQGGSESMEQALVPVDAVIEETLSRTTTIAETAGITVAVGGTEGLFVRGDRMLLVTALVNLVDNAIHYSPHGTPVSINRALRDGVVEVAVTDRGTGIPAAYQERVFERFFRADPARSRDTGGTGLGLAIVKHVAANHGGQVSLWSRTGTGSTFTLKLPANSDDQHGAAAASMAQPSVGTRFPTQAGSGNVGRAGRGTATIRSLSTSSSPSAVIPSHVKPFTPAAMSDPISNTATAPEQL
jgi:two-component system sensor histidine kinase SenX3